MFPFTWWLCAKESVWAGDVGACMCECVLYKMCGSIDCSPSGFCVSYNLRSSVQFSRSVVSDCLWPHGLQHPRLPCPSPTSRAYSDSSPSSWWCHPTISSSVILFSSRLQSFQASGSFPMSQFFTSGGQSTGVFSFSDVIFALLMNIQDWFPLGWTGWISLQSKGLKRLLQLHSSKA